MAIVLHKHNHKVNHVILKQDDKKIICIQREERQKEGTLMSSLDTP